MQTGEEKQLGRARDFALIRFVWTYVRPYRGLFFLSVILMPMNSAFALAQPYIIQLIVDIFLQHRHVAPPAWLAAVFAATGGASLLKMGAIYMTLVAGEFATFYAQFYLTVMVAQYSLSDLRLAVFNHVEHLPMSFFDRTPVGRLVSRMTTDIDAINEMFAQGSLTMFVDVMTMSGIVVIMWLKSPRLAMWAMISIPPLLLFINLFRVRARVVYRQIRERLAQVNAYLSESLAGMVVIQLFTRERTSRDEFDVLNVRSRDAQMAANIYETGPVLRGRYRRFDHYRAHPVGRWRPGAAQRSSRSARSSRSCNTRSSSSCRCAKFPTSTPRCNPRWPRSSESSS